MSELVASLPDLWRDEDAPADALGLLVYRSRLLGSDLRITNVGGGNTSAKAERADPVTGEPLEVLLVKGSGGDLGSLAPEGVAALDLARVRALERGYRGVEHEDEQAALLFECLVAPRGAAPSIDTPIHALIPARHVDHVHPDAVIALAAARDGERLTGEAFGDDVAWVPWQRPGFDLALRVRDAIAARPGLRGIVLGGHGLVAWDDDPAVCYRTTLELIDRAAAFLAREARTATPFGPPRVETLPPEERARRAAELFPLLRGRAGGERGAIGHFRDDPAVLEFAAGTEAPRLAAEGTSCPDHFLRTKRRPLLLELDPAADLLGQADALDAALARYRADYAAYYEANRVEGSPALRSPDPVVAIWPGVGMFTLAASKRDARIAAEFMASAVEVMRGAESVSAYAGLDDREAFRVEYWELEEAKLRRQPAELPLARKVALVTGATGGIGRAIARRFAAEGACVVLADLDPDGLEELTAELGEQALGLALDVTDEARVEAAFAAAARAFGGVDIVVNNAGVAASAPLAETSLADYERVQAVVARGSFLVSRAFARLDERQGRGGDIVYVVSKNAVFAGPENVAYGSAKAAQLHQLRLLAAELGGRGIRVNGVNPDAVVRDSKIFAGDWRRDRAEKYGIDPAQLGDFYASRSLLKREVLPDDVAAACFLLVSGELGKTTGAVIPVDGGVAAAFLR
ncbi:MAG TPA: bifunctional rhamnulose-1-phosphate aldolase/short-chain dehydrogenase [Gaiellaceae bacterium]|nr:bifunctional rhamnulose-1-phosphate aldolase/short-chain dehydrogenase [Gaiellaceae bacterium]